jgi:hypothetical protein
MPDSTKPVQEMTTPQLVREYKDHHVEAAIAHRARTAYDGTRNDAVVSELRNRRVLD